MPATNQTPVHPHSKLMTAITIVTLLVAAAAVTYYILQTRLVQPETVSQESAAPALDDPASPTATATETPVTVSSDASAATVTQELKQLNVADIEAAIGELQAALDLLQ